MELRTVALLARKELKDSLRTRWFLLYTAAFLALATSLSFVTTAFSGFAGLQGFGRVAAGLVNLVLLVVPLMGLTAGALAIAGERERRTLGYLLAQPVGRGAVFLGKFLGLAGALVAGLLVSFGLVGALLASRGIAFAGEHFPAFTLLTLLLALAALAVGCLISALAERVAGALGAVVFTWLTLVFLGDLGLMGTALLTRLGIRTVFAASLVNPLQVYKVAAVAILQPSLDVLGPVGLYAVDTLGSALFPVLAGVLVAWMVLPLAAAYAVFARREAA